ncbi:hypothetical protein EMIT079MI2_40081 [Bacillus sp. IT-79MI2]
MSFLGIVPNKKRTSAFLFYGVEQEEAQIENLFWKFKKSSRGMRRNKN